MQVSLIPTQHGIYYTHTQPHIFHEVYHMLKTLEPSTKRHFILYICQMCIYMIIRRLYDYTKRMCFKAPPQPPPPPPPSYVRLEVEGVSVPPLIYHTLQIMSCCNYILGIHITARKLVVFIEQNMFWQVTSNVYFFAIYAYVKHNCKRVKTIRVSPRTSQEWE